jgi:hypothetical protein
MNIEVPRCASLAAGVEVRGASGAGMELIPSETTLVVAGAWNMAILTPAWVQKHGLLKTDERVQVLMRLIPLTQVPLYVVCEAGRA